MHVLYLHKTWKSESLSSTSEHTSILWLQVLCQVYGVPLKPMLSHVELHRLNTRPAANEGAQPPQARSPGRLPQPYSIRTVKSAESSAAHELPANLVRPACQDLATQTMSAQSIHAGQRGNFVPAHVEPMFGHNPQQLRVGAHKRLPESFSADAHIKPAQAPLEEHLDRYYLAAAGRNLELLTDLIAGPQITECSLPVQGGVIHMERSNRPISPPIKQQGRAAARSGSRERRPPSEKILKESFEPTGGVNIVPRPVVATASSQQAAVSTASWSEQQQSSGASIHPSVPHQPLPWVQGAWMEQLAAVVTAAASAASAAMQAQQPPHFAKRPPSPDQPRLTVNADPPLQASPVNRHQTSPGRTAANISGSQEHASASTQVKGQHSHAMAAAAACADTPKTVERHGVERSVQTEDESSAGQSTTRAAPIQQGGVSGLYCDRSAAHGHSQAVQVLSSASGTAQAGPTVTLTQPPQLSSFTFAPGHFYGPVMEQQVRSMRPFVQSDHAQQRLCIDLFKILVGLLMSGGCVPNSAAVATLYPCTGATAPVAAAPQCT